MRKKSWFKRIFWDMEIGLILFIAFIIVARISAPYVGKYYINRVLAKKMAPYQGSIEDLSLRVITGSYFISDLIIAKKENPKLPFIYIKNLDVHLDWGMLFKGKAVLDLELKQSQINFVDSKEPNQKQLTVSKKQQKHWSEALDAIIPLSIEQLQINDLVVRFENKSIKGAENNKLEIKTAKIANLVDPEVRETKLSPFNVEGLLNGHAPMQIKGGLNITKENPDIDVKFELKKFNLTTTNKVLRHYVPVDVGDGKLSVLAEAKGNSRELKGNARVYLKSLDILRIDQKYESGLHFVIEWVGGFVNWVLDALTDKHLTTEIPFRIEKGSFAIDSSEAFFNTLNNLGEDLPYKYKSEDQGKGDD